MGFLSQQINIIISGVLSSNVTVLQGNILYKSPGDISHDMHISMVCGKDGVSILAIIALSVICIHQWSQPEQARIATNKQENMLPSIEGVFEQAGNQDQRTSIDHSLVQGSLRLAPFIFCLLNLYLLLSIYFLSQRYNCSILYKCFVQSCFRSSS